MTHQSNIEGPPLSASLHTSNNSPLYFIIHLEICNRHRLERAVAIAYTLRKGGHDVLITYEEHIAVRFTPDDTETLYWDMRKRINSWKKSHPTIEFRGIDTWAGDDLEGLAQAQEKRAAAIAELLVHENPSFIMTWGGNFEYQLGTHDGVARAGYSDRTIFCEVAWFPQQEFMYFDRMGVNSRSSLKNYAAPPLSPGQRKLLDAFRTKFRLGRAGNTGPRIGEKSVFVPLQIESDTSFRFGSPFSTNAEFMAFLQDWLPREYSATFKLHPKERVRAAPIQTSRTNFRVFKAGSLVF